MTEKDRTSGEQERKLEAGTAPEKKITPPAAEVKGGLHPAIYIAYETCCNHTKGLTDQDIQTMDHFERKRHSIQQMDPFHSEF